MPHGYGLLYFCFLGTLREGDGPRCSNCGAGDHKSWQCQDKPNVTNNVVCTTCGGVGHISKDCMGKKTGAWNEGPKTAMDEEYMSLMAELGEGPAPTPPPAPNNSGGGPNNSKEDKQNWRNNSGGPGRMFGAPPRAPRPLMGPRSGPPPPPPGKIISSLSLFFFLKNQKVPPKSVFYFLF